MYRDPAPYTFLGASNAVNWTSTGGQTPRHVRIAYGASPQTEMSVSWSSDAALPAGVLLVSSTPGAYDVANVTAAEAQFTVGADFCAAPATEATTPSGFFHHAFVGGLKPSTRYYITPSQGGVLGNETSFYDGECGGCQRAHEIHRVR